MHFRRIYFVFMTLTLLFGSSAVQAAERPLDRFFTQVHSYEASFKQVVFDDGMNVIQRSSGQLYLERPNRFRWNYDKPYKKQIVADGKHIWVYDVDLAQVNVRRMNGALGHTPAILLAGTGNLEKNFHIKELGHQGKLDWVEMIPRKNDGGFEDIRVGFEGNQLRQLDMVDGLGQTTRITLFNGHENQNISKKRFTFVVPKGVHVVPWQAAGQ